MKNRKLVQICAAATLVAGGAAAIAAPADAHATARTAPTRAADIPTTDVSYSDLNLSDPGGRAALQKRVGAAIESVCDSEGDWVQPGFAEQCKSRAWAKIRPTMVHAIQTAEQAPVATIANNAVAPTSH